MGSWVGSSLLFRGECESSLFLDRLGAIGVPCLAIFEETTTEMLGAATHALTFLRPRIASTVTISKWPFGDSSGWIRYLPPGLPTMIPVRSFPEAPVNSTRSPSSYFMGRPYG